MKPASFPGRGAPLLALLAANFVPLVGVVALGWELGAVMLLFWAENVVVGLWHAVKLAHVAGTAGLALVPFFLLHYGIFTVVHGVFVVTMFVRTPTLSPMEGGGIEVSGSGPWAHVLVQVLPGVLALAVSHGVSFFQNFLRGGEKEAWRARKDPRRFMFTAYGRVVVLHLTIIGGAWLMLSMGSPVAALVLLVVLKTGVDLVAHLAQRRGARAAGKAAREPWPYEA